MRYFFYSFFFVAIFLPSCELQTPTVQTQNTTSEKNLTTESCREALRIIKQHDFVDWKGLPDCTVKELFPDLNMSKTGFQQLGSERINADKKLVRTFDGYYQIVVFAREGRAVLLQGRSPKMEETLVETLVAKLGEPSGREIWWHGVSQMSNTEWIYPDQGITLFLNTEGSHLSYIVLYSPTTLEYYMKYLRPSTREYRRRKRFKTFKFKTFKR